MSSPVTALLAYFGGVFAAGFAFGVLRTLFVAPLVGPLVAELIEAPFMAAIVAAAAWLLARRYRGPRADLLAIGVFAAFLVLVCDVAVGFFLRGMSPYAVIFGRNILTGAVYYGLIAALAGLPYLFRSSRRD